MNIIKTEISELENTESNYNFFTKKTDYHSDIYPLPLISGRKTIWGHQIIQDAASNGELFVFCRHISGDAESNLIYALKMENRTDSYSWREKENILQFIDENRIDRKNTDILTLVQLEGSFIPNTEKYSELTESLKLIVEKDILDLKTALKLELLNNPMIEKTVDIIRDFSFSRKRLFINYIVETLKKNDKNEEEIDAILDKASSSDDPFEYVALMRYPALKRLENEFASYTEKYLKGSGIQLKPPPYFEGGGYSLQFSFKSKKQLGKIIERLEKVRETSDEIFRLL